MKYFVIEAKHNCDEKGVYFFGAIVPVLSSNWVLVGRRLNVKNKTLSADFGMNAGNEEVMRAIYTGKQSFECDDFKYEIKDAIERPFLLFTPETDEVYPGVYAFNGELYATVSEHDGVIKFESKSVRISYDAEKVDFPSCFSAIKAAMFDGENVELADGTRMEVL